MFMNMPRHTYHTKRTAGFTLVEIIVSLGIFAIVATVALGALVKIVSANKKAQTIQATVTNLNYALDAMSREMRVGKNYYCVSGNTFNLGALTDGDTANKCPTGYSNELNGRIIAFNSSKVNRTNPNSPCNLIYAYSFYPVGNGTYSLRKAEQTSCNNTSYSFNADSSIIDPNVIITGYYIRVTATASNPYSIGTVRISGYTGSSDKDKTYFDVQTTISSRAL